jgi:DNA repair protein RadA/Sms
MPKIAQAAHVCSDCGHRASKWFGRCPECGSWNIVTEANGHNEVEVASLVDISGPPDRMATGIVEIDRVLGGGLVPGEAVLLAGEPGIGKSTLVLQMIDALARSGKRCLLVSGEESLGQVALRARRLGVSGSTVHAATVTKVGQVETACASSGCDIVFVDSIQTMTHDDVDRTPGSPIQVQACAHELVAFAKRTGSPVVLVGHVTKDGSVAGPKLLEHVVDAVLTLEGERHSGLRLLRAAKNRFGSCEELGVFVMAEAGLDQVPDASAMLLEDRRSGVPGSTIFPALEGSRPLLVEVQALVDKTQAPQPRRVAAGIDARRLALLIGVLRQRANIDLSKHDVFLAAAGGVTLREPGVDLAACIALCSVAGDRPVSKEMICVGEIGLAGEVRRVPGVERRLAEAARLGFTRAIVPRCDTRAPRGMDVFVARDLQAALQAALG